MRSSVQSLLRRLDALEERHGSDAVETLCRGSVHASASRGALRQAQAFHFAALAFLEASALEIDAEGNPVPVSVDADPMHAEFAGRLATIEARLLAHA